MSKKLSREAMTKYQKDRRARIAAAVKPLESVKPSCKALVKPPRDVKPHDTPVTPLPEFVAPVPDYFRQCADQAARLDRQSAELRRKVEEITRLDALVVLQAADLARARAEVSRLSTLLVSSTQEQRPATTRPTTGRTSPPTTATKIAKEDDAAALTARVIAAKLERITNYSRGHVIGRV